MRIISTYSFVTHTQHEVSTLKVNFCDPRPVNKNKVYVLCLIGVSYRYHFINAEFKLLAFIPAVKPAFFKKYLRLAESISSH